MAGESSKKDNTKTSSIDQIKMDEQAQMVKIREEEIKALKRQLDVKDREAKDAKARAAAKDKERPKPETQGCCSGGCAIM